MVLFLLFPALTMSLGWGLRGFIGGGPLGAMIPGALIAMALCLLLRRDDSDAAVVAAFGAIGIGFGGQETYGQTIGLAFEPETHWWGIAGLALKGGLWGLLGGGVLGLALVRERHQRRDIVIALALMLLGTYAGWKLVNEPKLIYFSNPIDRPRPELWAGMLLGAAALLVKLRDRIVLDFALWSSLGGAVGFGLGGWIQVYGRGVFPSPWIDWWKVMELHFGFFFGLSLGYAAWRNRAVLQQPAAEPVNPPAHPLLAGLLVTAALYAVPLAGGRMPYSVIGTILLLLALYRTGFGWHVAVTMTYAAYSIDFVKAKPEFPLAALWTFVIVSSALIAWLVVRGPRVTPLFLLLLWTAVVNSYMKSFIPVFVFNGHTVTEIVFTALAAASTWIVFRNRAGWYDKGIART